METKTENNNRKNNNQKYKALSLFLFLSFLINVTLVGFLGFLFFTDEGKEMVKENILEVADTAITGQSIALDLPKDYSLGASYSNIGPRLLENGVIDFDKFRQAHMNNNSPLTKEQIKILKEGSDKEIVINSQNATFLLNLFWALGLANDSTILTKGEMAKDGSPASFASVGGWTGGKEEGIKYFASGNIINMTDKQTEITDQVAKNAYRPCCGNPTHFPDCNHGMALLGAFELMAKNGADKDKLYEAAKYMNYFWFPNQYEKIAAYFAKNKNVNFKEASAKEMVSYDFSSGRGYQKVARWAQNSYNTQAPSSGASCAL